MKSIMSAAPWIVRETKFGSVHLSDREILKLVRQSSLGLEPLYGRIGSISAKKPWCTVSHIMVTSLGSKWAAGKGSVSAGRRIGVSASQETRFRNVWHGRDALPRDPRQHVR